MGKSIAKLVVKMKSETSLSVETMGDSANQVFMAAAAVAHTITDTSNGNRKKAEAVMSTAKAIIDALFESMWKREYGNAPATEPVATAATAEKRNDPSASQPGDMDSMMEKIIADAMKQAKENPGQAQGVMFRVPAGDMPMEEVVNHIISAANKQARKDQNGGWSYGESNRRCQCAAACDTPGVCRNGRPDRAAHQIPGGRCTVCGAEGTESQ